MYYTCSTMLYPGVPREEVLASIKGLGFKSIDLWASGSLGAADSGSASGLPRHVDVDSEPADAVRREIEAHGMSTHAVSMFRCDVENKIKRIEYAAKLGADCVIFCPDKISYDEFAEGTMKPILPVCERLGVKLAIEHHVDRPLETIADMQRLVSDFPSKMVGFAIAPPHFDAAGIRTSDAIEAFADRVYSVYLWDIAKTFARTDEAPFWAQPGQMPGTGRIDFADILKTLKAVGYDGALNLGTHEAKGWPREKLETEIRKSIDFIRAAGGPA